MASSSVPTENSGFVDNWQSGRSLAECNLHMLTSEDTCDVNFRFGRKEKTVRAHRYVLISRSCVFHAMMCGPLAGKDDIKILDVEEGIFTEMLRFLYTNDATLTPDNVTGLLYLAKKYAVGGLEQLCVTYLEKSLSPDSACLILEQAHLFDEKDLHHNALKIIHWNGETTLTSPAFKDLCYKCFDQVVRSGDLTAKSETVFKAALVWSKAECERQGKDSTPENQREVLGETVFHLPFSEIGAEDFAKVIVPSKLLSGDECTKLFCFLVLSDTDIGPFKAKSKFVNVSTHTKCVRYDHIDQSNSLTSTVCLKPTQNIKLVGFRTYSCQTTKECKYNLSLSKWTSAYIRNRTVYDWKKRHTLEVTGKLSGKEKYEVEIQLPEEVTLEAGNGYRLEITQTQGKAKFQCTDPKSTITIGTCQIQCDYGENTTSFVPTLTFVRI